MNNPGVWLVLGFLIAWPSRLPAQPQDDAVLAEAPPEDPEPPPQSFAPGGVTSAFRDAAPGSAAPAQPPLPTSKLREQYPDLELQATPHHIQVGIFIGTLWPFQYVAFGLSTDIYTRVLPRLRLSTFATVGATTTWSKSRVTLYAELSVGVVVARWLKDTVVDLPEPIPAFHKPFQEEERKLHPALLPSTHSLEIEAGLIDSYAVLYRCSTNCADPNRDARAVEDESTFLLSPFVGIRYHYFRWARSARGAFRSASRLIATADALIRPLNDVAGDLQNAQGETIKRSVVGGRLSLQLPGFNCRSSVCVGLTLSGGYFPAPGAFMFASSMALY